MKGDLVEMMSDTSLNEKNFEGAENLPDFLVQMNIDHNK